MLAGFKFLAALITYCNKGWFDNLCNTLGFSENILVPLPAAKITTLSVIYFPFFKEYKQKKQPLAAFLVLQFICYFFLSFAIAWI
jgi:hypothetical protein